MRSAVWCLLFLAGSALCAQEYFPPGVLGHTAQEHEIEADRYSEYLKALHEPSLWELSQHDPKAEVYRFTWLRSFHHPISVRLVIRPSGSSWSHSRMTSSKGGAQPGRIIRYSNSWETKGRTASFIDVLEHADFWDLPTLVDSSVGPNGEVTVTLDGAEWIVEGVKNGHYRVVLR